MSARAARSYWSPGLARFLGLSRGCFEYRPLPATTRDRMIEYEILAPSRPVPV